MEPTVIIEDKLWISPIKGTNLQHSDLMQRNEQYLVTTKCWRRFIL